MVPVTDPSPLLSVAVCGGAGGAQVPPPAGADGDGRLCCPHDHRSGSAGGSSLSHTHTHTHSHSHTHTHTLTHTHTPGAPPGQGGKLLGGGLTAYRQTHVFDNVVKAAGVCCFGGRLNCKVLQETLHTHTLTVTLCSWLLRTSCPGCRTSASWLSSALWRSLRSAPGPSPGSSWPSCSPRGRGPRPSLWPASPTGPPTS